MSTPEQPLSRRDRLLRLIARLIEQTENDQIVWEKAAVEDGWAVDIQPLRFRIAAVGAERPTYVLDIMGPETESITTGPDEEWNDALQHLHQVGRRNALLHAPDPLRDVEKQLGLEPPARDA